MIVEEPLHSTRVIGKFFLAYFIDDMDMSDIWFQNDCVKNQVYADNPQFIEALKANIRCVILEIEPQLSKTVIGKFAKFCRLSTLYINKKIQNFHPNCVLYLKFKNEVPVEKPCIIFIVYAKESFPILKQRKK